MKTINDYIKRQENLFPLSVYITIGIMAFIFILAQILSIMNLKNETNPPKNKVEVRELMKLKFKFQEKKESFNNSTQKRNRNSYNRTNLRRETPENRQKPNTEVQIASILQGFNMKKLISRKVNTAKRGIPNQSDISTTGVSTKVDRQNRTVADYDLIESANNQSSNRHLARRLSRGGTQGIKVGTGGASSMGDGFGSSSEGIDISGRGTGRSTRGTDRGHTGGAKIKLPSGSGDNEAVIDIHALIKWMKAHPGIIPKLVAHDMGHQTRDLSSAIFFTMNGKKFRLFLSCNEIELLLRICLVDGNDFTLLKDNGIREESNFLIIGSVVRDRDTIQSLISSRRAPGNKAASFYQIFWSWWLGQQ